MEQQQGYSNDNYPGRSLGIAGLILGVITMMVAFVPCIGALALLPGITGLILSAIAISQSRKARAQNGIAISGLVCSILGCCIALVQLWFIKKATEGIIKLEKTGAFDTLSVKMQSLEVMADSMWHEHVDEK